MINVEKDLLKSLLGFALLNPLEQDERVRQLRKRFKELPAGQVIQTLNQIIEPKLETLSGGDISTFRLFYRRFYGSPKDLLINAVQQKNVLLVRKLIQMNCSLEDRHLALAWAIQSNQPEIVQFLKKKGAFLSDQAIDDFYSSVDKASLSDVSVLFFEELISQGKEESAFRVLERSGQIENPDFLLGQLQKAIRFGCSAPSVRKLLEKCKDKKETHQWMFSFMREAFLKQDVNRVKYIFTVSEGLLKFDLNQQIENGLTPLEFILVKMPHHIEFLEFIIKRGANIEISNENGLSPLQYTAFYGNERAMKKLLELGANPNKRSIEESTALHYLGYGFGRNYNDEKVYQSMHDQLIAHQADFRSRNYFYETAEAAKMGPFSPSSLERVLLLANGIEFQGGIDQQYPVTDQMAEEVRNMDHDQFSNSELADGVIPEDYLKGNYEAIHQRILDGKLTILKCGWKEHNIYLVFFEEFLVICNRAILSVPTLFLKKIDRKRLEIEDIENFHIDLPMMDPPAGATFFYQALPQWLKAEHSPLEEPMKAIDNKIQKVGNCRMNLKGAIRAAAALMMYKKKKEKQPALFTSEKACLEQFKECCQEARNYSKTISDNHRSSLLYRYKKFLNRRGPVVTAVEAKIESRLARHKKDP